ncbi:hypothetical protein WFZ85_05870 [Flavobacterium sp. j3]|uniref:Uncharacterized protein n=1 Tax=Flavobacterium aureirubrum TaxID=3133147 RepID=A0ABU9N868_9FLAO
MTQNEIQIVLEIIIIGLGLYLAFIKSYMEEKGKNLATKEDISAITKQIEGVKSEIEIQKDISKQKRELKYEALLKSLNLIDAYLSNFILDSTIEKQYATAEETRECYNNLILSCDNQETIDTFVKIMMEEKPKDILGTQYVLKELQGYRNIIRKELGFGEALVTNSNYIWISNVPYELKK